MKLKYKIWLDNNGKAFGRGPYQLLLGIRNTGSLAQAAKMMKMSYSHAHLLMKSLGSNLGFPLIESQAGGKGGGGTVITSQAEELLNNYTAFCKECDEVIGATFLKYFPEAERDAFNLNRIEDDQLLDVFAFNEHEVIVLVGGGGKTSIMYALASKFKEKKKKVIVCTTTKIFIPSPDRVDRLIVSEESDLLDILKNDKTEKGIIAIGTSVNSGKLGQVSPEFIDQITKLNICDHIIIEADGAARKPFKAPSPHEPVIPDTATFVFTVVGVDAYDKELKLDNVHRVKEISELTGLKDKGIINEDTIATVLVDNNGGKKNIPLGARWLPVINKVDNTEDLKKAEKIAEALYNKGVKEVVFSSVHENRLDLKIWDNT